MASFYTVRGEVPLSHNFPKRTVAELLEEISVVSDGHVEATLVAHDGSYSADITTPEYWHTTATNVTRLEETLQKLGPYASRPSWLFDHWEGENGEIYIGLPEDESAAESGKILAELEYKMLLLSRPDLQQLMARIAARLAMDDDKG